MDKTIVERFKSEWKKHDPPITDDGKKHALFVGTVSVGYKLQLEHMLNSGEPFDEIVIESSPFLRCMMTCAQVCKAMCIKQFRLNYMFSEHLEAKLKFGGQSPIPALTSRILDTPEKRQNFVNTHLDGIDFIDDDQYLDYISPRYPENDQDLHERMATCQQFFVDKYKNSNKRVLHIVVSHGTPIRYWS